MTKPRLDIALKPGFQFQREDLTQRQKLMKIASYTLDKGLEINFLGAFLHDDMGDRVLVACGSLTLYKGQVGITSPLSIPVC